MFNFQGASSLSTRLSRAVSQVSFAIIPNPPPFVNTFFHSFLFFSSFLFPFFNLPVCCFLVPFFSFCLLCSHVVAFFISHTICCFHSICFYFVVICCFAFTGQRKPSPWSFDYYSYILDIVFSLLPALCRTNHKICCRLNASRNWPYQNSLLWDSNNDTAETWMWTHRIFQLKTN